MSWILTFLSHQFLVRISIKILLLGFFFFFLNLFDYVPVYNVKLFANDRLEMNLLILKTKKPIVLSLFEIIYNGMYLWLFVLIYIYLCLILTPYTRNLVLVNKKLKGYQEFSCISNYHFKTTYKAFWAIIDQNTVLLFIFF